MTDNDFFINNIKNNNQEFAGAHIRNATSNDLIDLSEALTNNCYISRLSFNDTYFVDSIEILFDIIDTKNMNLLTFCNCIFDCNIFQHFMDVLKNNTSITKLIFNDCELDDIKFRSLIDNLEENNSIMNLKISSSNIKYDHDSILKLSNYISKNPQLRKLYFIISTLCENDFKMIAESLVTNYTLKILHFVEIFWISYEKYSSINPYKDISNKYFIEALEKNTTLEELEGFDVGNLLDPEVIASRRQIKKIKVCNC